MSAPRPDRAPPRWRQHPLVDRVSYLAMRAWAWSRRATGFGLGLRGVVWLAGFGALALALPPGWLAPGLPMAALLALAAAAAPTGGLVAGSMVSAIGLLAVRLGGESVSASILIAGLVGGLLYVQHSAAALAATLRTDTVIPPAVLWHWARRAAGVVAGSAVVGLAVMVLPSPANWSATSFLALGVASAVALVATLVWLARANL